MKRNFLVPVFSLGFLTVLSSAQVDISPGVARISLIQGDVSTQRGDTGDWAAAALNQPLVGGDRISTGDNSKAELQLDHANILRLGNNSQAKIATVERVQNERASDSGSDLAGACLLLGLQGFRGRSRDRHAECGHPADV